MSDFFHSGWSLYIALATIGGLLACLALLIIAARRRVMANDNTTGHVWDADLRELNNPLPRWWMWLFVATVVFSAVYLVLYPGLGSAPGTLGWSSVAQFEAERAKARAQSAPLFAGFASTPVPELARNAKAVEIGSRLFANNCSACHGSDGRGSKGFPDLTDTDWLWGGAPEQIVQTISLGRRGTMPPMATAVGSAEDVRDLANHVLSLSGAPHSSVGAARGRSKFGACAACHGAGGKGNPALGAPNLTDKVWLHGWGVDAIAAIVHTGKDNVMPAHASRLSAPEIHVLAAYVWRLSNGAASAASAAAP